MVLTGNQAALKPSRAVNGDARGIECVRFLWLFMSLSRHNLLLKPTSRGQGAAFIKPIISSIKRVFASQACFSKQDTR